MLTFAIKNQEINLNNSNLLIKKNAIYFEFLAEKKKLVNKKLIYYKTKNKKLFYMSIYLS